jgi:hypothetical protein
MPQTKAKTQVLIPFLILLALTIFSESLYAQERFPVAPAVPTTQDCENLSNAYLRLFRDGANQTSACLSGPANTGPGRLIDNFSTCSSYEGVRGYPQCFTAELSECQLGNRMNDETQACYARVPNASDSSLQNATNLYNNLQSSVGLYNNTLTFLTDPKQFIYDALMVYSANFANQMFNANGQVRPQYYSTANKIYAFAQNFAAYGMQQGMSGLPRAIALQSLEQIGGRFQTALADLARAMAMMDSIYISQNQYQAAPSNYSAQDSGTSYRRSTSNSSNPSGSTPCAIDGQLGTVEGGRCTTSVR